MTLNSSLSDLFLTLVTLFPSVVSGLFLTLNSSGFRLPLTLVMTLNSSLVLGLFLTLVMTLNSISLLFATLVINIKGKGERKPCPEVSEKNVTPGHFCDQAFADPSVGTAAFKHILRPQRRP